MVYAKKQLALREIHQQRNEIRAPALDFHMVALRDVVHPQVHFRAARHGHRRFFTDEEVRTVAQLFHRIDGIMVRNGHG